MKANTVFGLAAFVFDMMSKVRSFTSSFAVSGGKTRTANRQNVEKRAFRRLIPEKSGWSLTTSENVRSDLGFWNSITKAPRLPLGVVLP